MSVPPLSRRPIEALDPLYYGMFPTLYLAMTGYGFTLAIRYAPSFVIVTGPLYAQLYGIAVLAVCTLLTAVCCVLSIWRQNPKAEAYLTGVLLALFLLHAGYIIAASSFGIPSFDQIFHLAPPNPGTPRDSTPPQVYSVFTPVALAVCPAYRLIAIMRSGRMQRPGWW